MDSWSYIVSKSELNDLLGCFLPAFVTNTSLNRQRACVLFQRKGDPWEPSLEKWRIHNVLKRIPRKKFIPFLWLGLPVVTSEQQQSIRRESYSKSSSLSLEKDMWRRLSLSVVHLVPVFPLIANWRSFHPLHARNSLSISFCVHSSSFAGGETEQLLSEKAGKEEYRHLIWIPVLKNISCLSLIQRQAIASWTEGKKDGAFLVTDIDFSSNIRILSTFISVLRVTCMWSCPCSSCCLLTWGRSPRHEPWSDLSFFRNDVRNRWRQTDTRYFAKRASVAQDWLVLRLSFRFIPLNVTKHSIGQQLCLLEYCGKKKTGHSNLIAFDIFVISVDLTKGILEGTKKGNSSIHASQVFLFFNSNLNVLFLSLITILGKSTPLFLSGHRLLSFLSSWMFWLLSIWYWNWEAVFLILECVLFNRFVYFLSVVFTVVLHMPLSYSQSIHSVTSDVEDKRESLRQRRNLWLFFDGSVQWMVKKSDSRRKHRLSQWESILEIFWSEQPSEQTERNQSPMIPNRECLTPRSFREKESAKESIMFLGSQSISFSRMHFLSCREK